jgi:hypothetical protein
MIKIKIQNPNIDRNIPTFYPFLRFRDLLREYSIEITDSDDFDYLFVGMHDFINKQIPLKDSIEYGLENLSKISGDYFLFDGSDSTSLMGAYEVLKESDAIYLFKNQKLKNRSDYKVPYAFNKFFYGIGSKIDLSYDISKDDWNRIKFSHINLGFWMDNNYSNHMSSSKNKDIDLCAIFNAVQPENRDHGIRNDLLYTEHRTSLWKKIKPLTTKYNTITEKLPFNEYIKNLHNSKISLSPYGQGEFCFRDLESMVVGTLILKPSHEMVDTLPNLMIDDETFISCKYDWSDLEEKIEYVLSNFDRLNKDINYRIREVFNKNFNDHKFCKYYYDMFKNLSTVSSK